MNKAKWLNPDVPIELLVLKLSEEAAEVGTEISDMWMNGETMSPPFTRAAELEIELDHVEFFCAVIRGRINS